MTTDRPIGDAVPRSTPRFHERQRLPGPLRFLTVTTEIDDECLHVRLSSLLSPLSRRIPLARVRHVETHEDLSRHIPGTFRYWFMGVQIVPRVGWAINPGNARGVTVRLDDGWRLVIGSRRPNELAEAVRALAPTRPGGDAGKGKSDRSVAAVTSTTKGNDCDQEETP